MISFARFGPVITPTGRPGISSAATSVIRMSDSRSMPFERLTIGTHGRRCGAASRATARNPCDGTAITTTSASATASSIDAVARRLAGSVNDGR